MAEIQPEAVRRLPGICIKMALKAILTVKGGGEVYGRGKGGENPQSGQTIPPTIGISDWCNRAQAVNSLVVLNGREWGIKMMQKCFPFLILR